MKLETWNQNSQDAYSEKKLSVGQIFTKHSAYARQPVYDIKTKKFGLPLVKPIRFWVANCQTEIILGCQS